MPTPSHLQSGTEYRREELRGLFTLGLLAVLVVIRFQNEKLPVKIGQSSIDFIPFINFTIILWSLYAFFMVLGLSDDVIGNSLAEMFRNLSKYCLRLDFILSAILGTLYFILGYSTRSLWIIGLIGSSSLCVILLSLRKTKIKKIWKKPKITKLDLLESGSIILFLIFAMALFLYPDEQYLVVFFVLGLGSFIAFGLVKEKQSREKSKSE
jgi:hypothetical protein